MSAAGDSAGNGGGGPRDSCSVRSPRGRRFGDLEAVLLLREVLRGQPVPPCGSTGPSEPRKSRGELNGPPSDGGARAGTSLGKLSLRA